MDKVPKKEPIIFDWKKANSEAASGPNPLSDNFQDALETRTTSIKATTKITSTKKKSLTSGCNTEKVRKHNVAEEKILNDKQEKEKVSKKRKRLTASKNTPTVAEYEKESQKQNTAKNQRVGNNVLSVGNRQLKGSKASTNEEIIFPSSVEKEGAKQEQWHSGRSQSKLKAAGKVGSLKDAYSPVAKTRLNDAIKDAAVVNTPTIVRPKVNHQNAATQSIVEVNGGERTKVTGGKRTPKKRDSQSGPQKKWGDSGRGK